MSQSHPTSNENTQPPHDVALPKITPEIWKAYQDEEFITDFPRWDWTQAAVDFACEIVRPAVRSEIERLRRELDLWKERHDRERAAHAKNLTEQQRVEAELRKYRGIPEHWIGLDGENGEPLDPAYMRRPSDETDDARLLTFAKYILQHCNYHRLRDHACPRCMPEGGDLVKADFVCAYHQAKDYAEQHGWTDPRASGAPT